MIIKTEEELNILKRGGKILAEILNDLKKYSREGVSTKELNERAMALIFKFGAKPSFLGYQNYPAALCTSINEEVVHVPPSKRKLKNGDILSLDLGIWYQNLCIDAAITFAIGETSPQTAKLIRVTKKALEIGISKAKAGNRLGDIGFAIWHYIERNDFGVVRELAGHAVGRAVHEEPFIPNFGEKGKGEILAEGMVIAIEPMATAGNWRVKTSKDGYGFKTIDNSLSAHFEHTIVVTKNKPIVLTK